MTQVKIGNIQIDASVSGRVNDSGWNGRSSKSITCKMTYAEAVELFVDWVNWSIIYQEDSYIDSETGETITPEPVEYDNSEYSVAGPITDNRDGTVTVKMGKPTDIELMQKQLTNAVTQEELTTAYIEGVNSL